MQMGALLMVSNLYYYYFFSLLLFYFYFIKLFRVGINSPNLWATLCDVIFRIIISLPLYIGKLQTNNCWIYC